ncbi:SPOR domain-containing protein [Candidatus Ferrigenium straubiae]|jgi:DedD protein|uniref:SPOR domain-containing protein n=1 Tax=Candidatus Ferrigenium straubiae TaxID=2919506 RepID=UPI003F4AE8E7
MAKQPTDDELDLRRKARRRLIGAVALTLAVVVILPMVLDSEPKSTGQDIELRIPAPDKVGEFVPGAAASEVAQAAPLAVSAVEAAPAAASAVAASAVAQAKPVAAAAAAGNPKVEAQGKIQAANKQPEAAGAKSAAKPSGESFVAQVGAYANPNTAKLEADRLKKLGFRAYTEKAGDKTRVRVGPYAERDKAEKVRLLLEKHGLHPVVTSAK